MFTTHYHKLVEDYKLQKGIALYQMASEIVKDGDSEDKIKFLYKF